MQTYYTKLQLKNIIKNAEEEDRIAKKEGRKSNNPWNIKRLKKVVDEFTETEKDVQEKNPTERGKAIKNSGIKFVTCFQRGFEAPFYTFAPGLDENENCVRTTYNTNPTGDMPVNLLYAHQDLMNPYGRGLIEIAGGTQNVLDYFTQHDVLATQIGYQPPVRIRGDRTQTNLSSMVFSPSAFWFVGNAEIDFVKTDSQIYSQFPSRYGLYKTQLMNLIGSGDASVSAESGNPQYSKTPQGVQLQQERMGAHDNYLRQRCDEAYGRLANNMLNIHFANMQGTDRRKLIDEEAERLMKTGMIDQDPATKKPSAQEIEIIWDNVRGQFEFEVDANSSIQKDDKEQVESMIELATLAAENPMVQQSLMQSNYRLDLGELWKDIIIKKGASNWEKILVPISPEEGMA